MKLNALSGVALTCYVSAMVVQASRTDRLGIPHLQEQGVSTQLIVDGKPFLALTGDLGPCHRTGGTRSMID